MTLETCSREQLANRRCGKVLDVAKKRKNPPKNSPSQAISHIKAGLKAIVDPHPSADELAQMWKFFRDDDGPYQCAFCDGAIVPGTSGAHRDHLLSRKHGGLNHISNRVPACYRCNGNDKREMDWRDFLRSRPGTEEDFRRREARIMAWLERWSAATRPSEELLRLSERKAYRVIQEFQRAVRELRQARVGGVAGKANASRVRARSRQ